MIRRYQNGNTLLVRQRPADRFNRYVEVAHMTHHTGKVVFVTPFVHVCALCNEYVSVREVLLHVPHGELRHHAQRRCGIRPVLRGGGGKSGNQSGSIHIQLVHCRKKSEADRFEACLCIRILLGTAPHQKIGGAGNLR